MLWSGGWTEAKCIVGQVMELVELESLSPALVGKPGLSGLSVEQRKRLTIAVELVANPSIIFMVCCSLSSRHTCPHCCPSMHASSS